MVQLLDRASGTAQTVCRGVSDEALEGALVPDDAERKQLVSGVVML